MWLPSLPETYIIMALPCWWLLPSSWTYEVNFSPNTLASYLHLIPMPSVASIHDKGKYSLGPECLGFHLLPHAHPWQLGSCRVLALAILIFQWLLRKRSHRTFKGNLNSDAFPAEGMWDVSFFWDGEAELAGISIPIIFPSFAIERRQTFSHFIKLSK